MTRYHFRRRLIMNEYCTLMIIKDKINIIEYFNMKLFPNEQSINFMNKFQFNCNLNFSFNHFVFNASSNCGDCTKKRIFNRNFAGEFLLNIKIPVVKKKCTASDASVSMQISYLWNALFTLSKS